MPRRTRAHLSSQKPKKTTTATRKSKSKNNNRYEEDLEPPSEQKWATMTPYGSFIVSDVNGTEHLFAKDDFAIIVPAGRDPQTELEPWKYWVAKIVDIRAIVYDENSNTVWARVQWFYSGKDVSDVMKSLDRDIIGKYERVFSDHFDVVAPEAFNGVVTVTKFREDDPEQVYIHPQDFYHRYTLQYKARKLQPKPGSSTCVCSIPYAPDDTDPSRLMHFCPRPSCRTAYHEECLLNMKSQDPSPVDGLTSPRRLTRSPQKHASVIHVKRPQRAVNGSTTASPTKMTQSQSRALRLLACSPDTDDEVDLESLIPITVVQGNSQFDTDTESPRKKRRGRSSKKIPSSPPETTLQQPLTLTDVLSSLPLYLLKIAQQPLVRGGAFAIGGVAGNIGAVTRARRIVYEVLEGGEVPDDWEDLLLGEDAAVANAIVKLPGGKKIPPLLCPKCNSAI